MSPLNKIVSKLTAQNNSAFHRRLLTADELQHAILCERDRSDRREIPFSLLVIALDLSGNSESDAVLENLFERIRLTDQVGLIDRKHLGVLLPDTEGDSACKVALDLQEIFDLFSLQPRINVFTYPFDAHELNEDGVGEDIVDEDQDQDSSHHPPGISEPVVRKPAATRNKQTIEAQELSFAVPTKFSKRALDIIVSLFTLILLAPLFLITAILIKLTSKGPVFFSQWREGKNGQKFKIYKFRTMTQNAESLQSELRHLSEQDGPAFKIEKDPRLTWFGAFLRKSCIDETPQFINVLRGDMSLVGPRPLPVNESQACTRWQRRRLDVTPGMTCIWQVNGNRHLEFDQWMRMDIEYIQKSGFITDFLILFRTALFVLLRKASV